MPTNTQNPSPFHNLSDAQLADEIGALDAEHKKLSTRLKAAKDALRDRGIETANGDRYCVKVVVSTRQSLDTAALKKSFSEDVLARFQKLTDVFSVRVGVAS